MRHSKISARRRILMVGGMLVGPVLLLSLPVGSSAALDGVPSLAVRAVDKSGFVGESGSNLGGGSNTGGNGGGPTNPSNPGTPVVMEEWLYTFRIYGLEANAPIRLVAYSSSGDRTETGATAVTNNSGFYAVAAKIRVDKNKLLPMRMDIVVGHPGNTRSYSYTFTERGSYSNSKNIVLNAKLEGGVLVKAVL